MRKKNTIVNRPDPTHQEVYAWLHNHTDGFKQEYYMGLCVDTADYLVEFLQGQDYEQWELYDIHRRVKYKHLPLVIPDSLCGTFPPLADLPDADFFHVVIKYKGYYWDGSGQHESLEVISSKYTQCKNPHWFRTA